MIFNFKYSLKTQLLLKLIFILGSVILLNVLFNDVNLQYDSTNNNLYTLSNYSKSILNKVNDPITIDFYIADNLPAHVLYQKNQVLHLLEEFSRYSKGLIKLNIIKKEVSDDFFNILNTMGISKIQMNIFEDDEFKLVDTFCGFVMLYQDQQASIPVALEVDSLEYDMSVLINKFITKKESRLVFVHNDRDYINEEYSLFIDYLNTYFDVSIITYQQLNNDVIDLALFIQPDNLSKHDLRHLSSFVNDGNEAIFFIDQYKFKNLSASQINTNLSDFFNPYGIKFNHHLVLDSNCENVRFYTKQKGYDFKNKFLHKYPYFPVVKKQFFQSENPALMQFNSVVFPYTSSFILDDYIVDNFTKTILVSSNDTSWKEYPPHNLLPQRPFQSFNMNSYPLIVHLNGFFEDPAVSVLKSYVSLILVGSSSVISNRTVSDFSGNASFFLNLIEWELANSRVDTLPNRRVQSFNLNPVSSFEKMLLKWISMLFVPFIFSIIAIYKFFKKMREKNDIKK